MSKELNDAERQIVECYRTLADVLENQRGQLAPFAERNAAKALAALWQVMNGLDQDPGQLYELGV
ncbi:MAG: hypothetical protein ACRDHB_07940 [Actinomycetota bacterium]